MVKVWDIRKVAERGQYDGGQYSINSIALDKSGQTLGVACEDGQVKLFSEDGKGTGKLESKLKAHTGAASGVVFEGNTRTLVSVGADGEYKFWN